MIRVHSCRFVFCFSVPQSAFICVNLRFHVFPHRVTARHNVESSDPTGRTHRMRAIFGLVSLLVVALIVVWLFASYTS